MREPAAGARKRLVEEIAGPLIRSQETCIRLLSERVGERAPHEVNVTVISLLLGKACGLDEAGLHELGVAALLHDIGKLELPDRLRYEYDSRSAAEQLLFQNHVGRGVAAGVRMGLSDAVLKMIAQHHERADGNGYPAGVTNDRMSPGARILAVVNHYDNLCNPGNPALALTPHEALSQIFAHANEGFDAATVNVMVRMMGVYPAGSIVQLTDDRHALVVSVNAARPLKPRIIIHDPAIPRAAALVVDLADHPALGIRRSVRPLQLPRAAMDYLSPRPRICYFFEHEEVSRGLSDEILSETILRRADGSTLTVERRISRVAIGGRDSVYLVGIKDRSEQRRVEDELEKLVAELRATLESTADGILVVDLAHRIRSYNQRFAELWDIPYTLMTRRADAATHDWLARSVVDPDGYASRLEELRRSPLLEATDVIVLRSGRVLERVSLPQYARGRPVGRVFSYRDITRRLADESRLQLAAKVFSASLDAILITDREHRVVAANAQSQKSSGYPEAELVGKRTDALLYKPGDETFVPCLLDRLQHDGYWEGELWYRRKDGSGIPVLASLVRAREKGEAPRYILFFKPTRA